MFLIVRPRTSRRLPSIRRENRLKHCVGSVTIVMVLHIALPHPTSVAQPPEPPIESASTDPIDVGRTVPIPAGAVFRPYMVRVGEVSSSAASGSTGSIVYSNRLGNSIYVPGGNPGALVADDIATLVSVGCTLDTLRFRVSGDPLRDGSGVGGFSVDFALYSGCPGAGGFPVFPPVTQQFVDNGNYEVVFQPDLGTEITVPLNSYFGVSFSRSWTGIVMGAPATAGFSADSYDFPGARCDAHFGEFPEFDHASFDLEITSRNDCPEGMCSRTCTGGDNAGEFCTRDDCPGGTCIPDIACTGGTNNGGPCSTDADCPNACSGGANSGDPCTHDSECPNECRGGANAGDVCGNDDDCPESICSIGVCPTATCTRDKCVGGSGAFCSVDDCPSGSCDGAKACDGGTSADQACVYDCVPSFPAYKNSSQGGQPLTFSQSNTLSADDIRLAIPVDENNPCYLVSWEVGFKGGAGGSAGAIQAALHTFLDADDPEFGGRIAGTKVTDIIAGSTVKMLKRTFTTPIPITQRDLFVVFRTQNSFVGAIRTCKEADLGSTEDVYFEHDGDSWTVKGFDAGCIAAFEITLSCAGSPPAGACCDMALTEGRTCIGGPRDGLSCNRDSQCRVCIGGSNDGFRCDQDIDCSGGFCPPEGRQFCIGDAVCRELPEMNCAFPELWREDEHCGPVCDGGAEEGEPCAGSSDCPAGCVGGGRDGQPCSSDPECPGVCEDRSAFAGNACFTDSQCRTFPGDTSLCVDFGTCGDPGFCRGQFCVGGVSHGQPCSRAIDCPDGECGSSCMGGDNDGLPCLQDDDCPAGFCSAIPFPQPCGLDTCCTSNALRCCVTEKECHTAGTPCGLNQEPLDTPVQFHAGFPCTLGGCGHGCIGIEGSCFEAHGGVCVGGTHDGEICDPTAFHPCGFFGGGGVCVGTPGCEDPVCCAAVCELDSRCCSLDWSQACANIAFELPECYRIPANDTCFDFSPEKGALFLPVNSSVEVDLKNAQGGSSQPGLCCYRQEVAGGPGPGSLAEAVVWLKTIAPANGTCRGGTNNGNACTQDSECDSGKCRANLRVDTCNTIGGRGDDSIIQVFFVGDQDSGLCEDLSFCKISLQDCFDQSECVLDEETMCGSLSPIGCSDDVLVPDVCRNSGGTDLPHNSILCVDVVPGDPYYIMVAAKDFDARGKYRVRTSEFCTVDPPVLFNDLCSDAEPIGGAITEFGCDGAGNCDKAFNLAGLGNSAPATFDCPGPRCLNTMENDVWYDWTAPATGRVSAETCDGLNTPDTSLVLYNGCDCPAGFGNELACSETVVTPDCLLGSRVTARVQGGRCYKFRLGGHLGGTPSGTLNIDFDPCPPGPITAVDPPNFAIDARAPLDPFTQLPLGIDSFTIKWPGGTGGTTDKFCYSYCETLVDGFDPNLLFGLITDNGDDTFTINLARPLAPGAHGTLTVTHRDGSTTEVFAASLPGDANGSGSVAMADLDFLVAGLNGLVPFDKYRYDMDQSEAFTPRDLLRWLDLARGLPGAFDAWLGAPLPPCDLCCPSEGCIGMEGPCFEAHDGICVGGGLDGEPCKPGELCLPGSCCGQGGVCQGQGGCESPVCCMAVCEVWPSCCSQHWSQSCTNIALEVCQ